MNNEKLFKVGQYLTYKSRSECKDEHLKDGYFFGGADMGGIVGKIIEYSRYEPKTQCWSMEVDTGGKGHSKIYTMMENEFLEYDYYEKKKEFQQDLEKVRKLIQDEET